MRLAPAILALFGFGLPISVLARPIATKEIPHDSSVVALSVETLIERLQDEAPGDPQRRWPAMVLAFQPLDVPQRFEQNLPRDPRSPVMTELIRRGVDAVPQLLVHLTDARPTHLVEYHTPNMINDGGTWFADVYDPLRVGAQFDPSVNHEVDFNSTRELKAGQSYTIKVGDLCFFALGQIVNRRLLVLGPVMKGGSLWIRSKSLNSPVEVPALAAAARKDWTGLTRSSHEKLLEDEAWENDALGAKPARGYDAVQRLAFYYPDESQHVIADLLRRTLIDYDEIVELAVRLQREPLENQVAIVGQFQREHSTQAYDALHRVVFRDQQGLGGDTRADLLAAAMVNCFPDHKIRPNDRILEVSYRDQAEFVNTLEAFDYPELHDSLFELFDRAARQTVSRADSRFSRNELLLACAQRLRGTRHFDICAKTIRSEINDLSARLRTAQSDPDYNHPGSDANRYRTYQYALNTWLASANQLIAAQGGK